MESLPTPVTVAPLRPSSEPQDFPDSDAIKMFVGQVPRDMGEQELKEVFKEFGPVFQLNVLKDKTTGVCQIMFIFSVTSIIPNNSSS